MAVLVPREEEIRPHQVTDHLVREILAALNLQLQVNPEDQAVFHRPQGMDILVRGSLEEAIQHPQVTGLLVQRNPEEAIRRHQDLHLPVLETPEELTLQLLGSLEEEAIRHHQDLHPQALETPEELILQLPESLEEATRHLLDMDLLVLEKVETEAILRRVLKLEEGTDQKRRRLPRRRRAMMIRVRLGTMGILTKIDQVSAGRGVGIFLNTLISLPKFILGLRFHL